jgi:hypothetical protein
LEAAGWRRAELELTEQVRKLALQITLFAVLGVELRAYTLSYSIPFFVMDRGLTNYLPELALNHNPSGLCLLSR